MELLQLRYFCTVAHYQSVTRAAAELMISQPALSKTIRNCTGTTYLRKTG